MEHTYRVKGFVYLENEDITLEDLDLYVTADDEEVAHDKAKDLAREMYPDNVDYDIEVEEVDW